MYIIIGTTFKPSELQVSGKFWLFLILLSLIDVLLPKYGPLLSDGYSNSDLTAADQDLMVDPSVMQ